MDNAIFHIDVCSNNIDGGEDIFNIILFPYEDMIMENESQKKDNDNSYNNIEHSLIDLLPAWIIHRKKQNKGNSRM